MKFVLDSYQIASGYTTGLGALLEMEDFLEAGNPFFVENWMVSIVQILSAQDLKNFAKRYDAFINW